MGSLTFYITYFGLLITDLILIYINPEGLWRPILEPLLMIILTLRFKQRYKKSKVTDPRLVYIALAAIMLGGLFLLDFFPLSSFLVGFCFFMIANLSYTLLFYRCADLRIKRAVPFIIFASFSAMTLLYIFYDVLGNYFVPGSFFLLVLLNCVQAAYLRYGVVNNLSFYLVFIGVIFFFTAQVAAAYFHFISQNLWIGMIILISFFVSQILIIKGILCTDEELARLPHIPLSSDASAEMLEKTGKTQQSGE